MVLQRGPARAIIWGTVAPNETVTVTFDGNKLPPAKHVVHTLHIKMAQHLDTRRGLLSDPSTLWCRGSQPKHVLNPA